MNNLKKLENKLKYNFKNERLIDEALTHKSCKKEYNNERLEFLGDAVLDLVVGEYLFDKFSNVCEGDLSKLRASLVSEKGFTKLANLINLGDYIHISISEEKNKGRDKSSILSNAFEALMGAIYLESSLKDVQNIMHRLMQEAYPKIDLESIFRDYKTTLQELTQSIYGVTPNYIVVSSSGPDHKKEFEVSVRVHDKELARSKGKSKKEAQQEAAKIALEILKDQNE